ncbi:PTS transporter subunit IIC [Erysipelothrix urinaevulpis]|uniref:PTS transporter subunit IIC n=1 Tax=Erysipelothrix urinaevulpis TaxID=2683717 RepID=UPI001358027C|nr:PTS sugar transporter subunit IIC [Erysipelothrix urinaevulpis]
MENKIGFKEFTNKVLTGMSVGIVVALIPGALLGELAKAFEWTKVAQLTGMATSLLPVIMGLTIAMQFKLNPIQSGTLAITTAIGSGVMRFTETGLTLVGIGDVVNAGIVAGLAVFAIQLIGNRLKAYTILVVPALVTTVIGGLGLFVLLPVVSQLTGLVGTLVSQFTDLTPIVAGILISVTFAVMIVSPLSTAGVALTIGLSGVGSGAANLGICAAGFGLAISGYKQNGFGTSIAHFLGSPKMQMANFIKKPSMMIPIIANAAVCGAFAGILNIVGTPASAGFGISGLIGPLNHLNIVGYTMSNLLITALAFIAIPVAMGFVFDFVFKRTVKLVSDEDYAIKFD